MLVLGVYKPSTSIKYSYMYMLFADFPTLLAKIHHLFADFLTLFAGKHTL